jgi:hypothetical protein
MKTQGKDAMTKDMRPEDFKAVYDRFQANVSRFDCGRFCAPLNEGQPVCCDTKHAIPVVDKPEFDLLKSRTDLWHRYKPTDATARKIVDELHKNCRAIECKGARFCERDNRTLACRAFPFYPYFDRAGELLGLGTYWIFADRCWLISNMQVVERDFVREFIDAYQYVFARDAEEKDAMKRHSANHRRISTRYKKPILLIGKEGGFLKVMPGTAEVRTATPRDMVKTGPYKSPRAYARAVKEAGGEMPAQSPFID